LGLQVPAKRWLASDSTFSKPNFFGLMFHYAWITPLAAVLSFAVSIAPAAQPADRVTLFAALIAQSTLAMGAFGFREIFAGLGRIATANWIESAGALIPVIVASLAVAGTFADPFPFIVWALPLGRLSCVIAGVVSLRLIGPLKRPVFPRARIATARREGGYVLLVVLTQTFAEKGDRILVGWLGSAADLGIYTAAATLSDAVLIVTGAVAQIALYRSASRRNDARGQRGLLAIAVASAVACAFAVWLVSPFVIRFLGSGYSEAGSILPLMLLGAVVASAYYVVNSSLFGRGQARLAAVAPFCASAVVLVVDLILIPIIGLTGAAVTNLLGYSVLTAVALFMSRQTRSGIFDTPGSPAVPERFGEGQ